MTPRSHRLAAVWFADIAGYTELSTRDEDHAVALVELMQEAAGESVRGWRRSSTRTSSPARGWTR